MRHGRGGQIRLNPLQIGSQFGRPTTAKPLSCGRSLNPLQIGSQFGPARMSQRFTAGGLNPLQIGSQFGPRHLKDLTSPVVRLNPLQIGSQFGRSSVFIRVLEFVLIPFRSGFSSDFLRQWTAAVLGVLIPFRSGLSSDGNRSKRTGIRIRRLNPLQIGSQFGPGKWARCSTASRLNPLQIGSQFGLQRAVEIECHAHVLIPFRSGLSSDSSCRTATSEAASS